MLTVVFCIFAIIWWVVLAVSFTKDRSRYRNCYFLFFSLLSTVLAAASFTGDDMLNTLAGIVIFTSAVIMVVPVFLIHNGVVMYRNEGHSLANLLSFVFGIVIGVGEIATVFILLTGTHTDFSASYPVLTKTGLFISVSVIYVSVSFLIFMFYSLFLMIIPRKKDFDYVIIHGAGLLDGNRVSKLLSDRIDKAVEVYRKDPTPPVLIPSGGKGDDETVSEAEAMGAYLLEKGIPEENIVIENTSATTLDNLRNSKAIIDAREGSKYTALVTSNYHVYRALRYCRKIDLKCTGIGSRVALYFWPSALIREYIAVHAEKKHLIAFIAGWLICISSLFI